MIDHVGYLVRDLDRAVADVTHRFGLEATRTVDRPQWSLFGYYVGQFEVFTFTDAALLDARLGGEDARLDHVAWKVDDIAVAMSGFAGVRWSGPDLRETVTEPFDLGGTLHAWTVVDGLGLQLVQYPASA